MSNNGLPHPLFLIPRFGKRRTLSKQTQKDQELTADRLRRNEGQITKIMSYLETLCGPSPQKKDLIIVARKLGKDINVSLDRLAKRSRDCLLCWFCENWSGIAAKIDEMCATQPRIYDSRNSCVALDQSATVNSASNSESEQNTSQESPSSPAAMPTATITTAPQEHIIFSICDNKNHDLMIENLSTTENAAENSCVFFDSTDAGCDYSVVEAFFDNYNNNFDEFSFFESPAEVFTSDEYDLAGAFLA